MSVPGNYQVGAATVDITPTLNSPVYMAGFAPNRKAKSVLHPLTAGILYIRDSHNGALALITLDLIGLMNPCIQRIKDGLSDILPPERVVVASTHTHAGPDTMGLWGKALLGMLPIKTGVDKEYLDTVIHRVIQGVHQAIKESVPAQLSVTTFDTPSDWVRNDRDGGGAYPRGVALIATQKDEPEAVIFNYASHPEALWEKNHELSPDYPSPFRTHLKELGVETPLFFSGPLGAMLTPNVPPGANREERKRFVENLGRQMAEFVYERIAEAEPITGPIQVATRPLVLKNTNKRFEWARRFGLFDRDFRDQKVESEMTVGSIGSFRFATIPGEPCPEVGHRLYDALGEGHRMLFALGMDELGYIIPPEFFDKKEYKYETTMSLGPHMADTMVEHVRELQSQLSA